MSSEAPTGGAGGSPPVPKRKTHGGLLEFGGDAPARKRVKGGVLELGGGAGNEGRTGGQRVVSQILLKDQMKAEAEQGGGVRASVKEFLELARKAGPGVNLEDPSADDGAETLEINLAVDDLIEAKDIDATAPDRKDTLLLPTANTQAHLREQQFHQQAALTSMVLSLLDKDSQAGSDGSDSDSDSDSTSEGSASSDHADS